MSDDDPSLLSVLPSHQSDQERERRCRLRSYVVTVDGRGGGARQGYSDRNRHIMEPSSSRSRSWSSSSYDDDDNGYDDGEDDAVVTQCLREAGDRLQASLTAALQPTGGAGPPPSTPAASPPVEEGRSGSGGEDDDDDDDLAAAFFARQERIQLEAMRLPADEWVAAMLPRIISGTPRAGTNELQPTAGGGGRMSLEGVDVDRVASGLYREYKRIIRS